MGDWKEKPLGEILKLTKGISYKSSDYGTEDEGVIFINLKCIAKSGGFSRRGVKYYKGYVPENLKLKEGDVIIANTDLTRNGDIVGCPLILPNLQSDEVTMSMDLSRLDIISNEVDEKFVYYALMTSSARKFMKENSSGSTVLHLKTSKVPTYKILIPLKKGEQSTIATILTTIDQAIEKTEQLIAKYERIKTGLMQDLLTRGIDEQGNIRSEETHEFKDSVLGRIPREWEVVNIGSISEHIGSGITPRGGSAVYQSSGIMLIRSQNVYPDGFKLEDVAYISEEINNTMLRSEVHEYDVLLNITGASIGRCTYVPEDFAKANVNQHVCAIRLFGKNLSKAVFLSEFLNSESGQNQIFKYNAGSNREGLNYSQIRGIELSLPIEDDEFGRISKVLIAYSENLKSLEDEFNKYSALKKSLMQDLLTGKVRVDALMSQVQETI